jgi:hypothetical protein
MRAAIEPYVTDEQGRKTGVILSLKRYQKLLEDLHDLAVVAERREEKPVSLGAIKRRLKKDDVLTSGIAARSTAHSDKYTSSHRRRLLLR